MATKHQNQQSSKRADANDILLFNDIHADPKIGDLGKTDGMTIPEKSLSVKERCKAIDLIRRVLFATPVDGQFVRPLIEGVGEHEKRKELESYEVV